MESELQSDTPKSAVAKEDRFDLLKDLAEFSGNSIPSNLTDLLQCWEERFRPEASGTEEIATEEIERGRPLKVRADDTTGLEGGKCGKEGSDKGKESSDKDKDASDGMLERFVEISVAPADVYERLRHSSANQMLLSQAPVF